MRIVSCLVACLVASVVAAAAAPQGYEITWVDRAPDITVGTVFAKGARIVLPAEAQISFIDWTGPAPVQRVCAGAYSGVIEACSAGGGARSRLAPGGTRGAPR